MLAGDRVEMSAIRNLAVENSGKLKVYDSIVENWSDVERNYALMQLTETALTTMTQLHVKEVLGNIIPKMNRFELIRQMGNDNLTNTIPNINGWISDCFNKLNNFIRE